MLPDADSAGQPFAGRSFQPHPFAGDTGEADPRLVSVLGAFHQIAHHLPESRPYDEMGRAFEAVLDALRSARLLTPLIAEAGDYGVTDSGKVVEKTQELSIIHVEGPDGRAVAPVFSDVAAMASWRADARPIPVEAARAAIAAAADGLSVMVLNPGSASHLALRRGAIEALASGSAYRVPWRDPEVLAAIERGVEDHANLVTKHRVIPGDLLQQLSGPDIVVALGVEPGLDAESLQVLLAQLSVAWSEDPVLSRKVDGIGIKVLPA